jgi:hypothetical protein
MGFTVSTLTNYVNEQSKELLVALQFEAETGALANVQTGIKSSAALQLLSNSPVPQDGSSCGFNASGDTTFTQRILATSAIKYQDTLCPRTLETKWTQIMMKKGQNYDDSFAPEIMRLILSDVLAQIKRRQETADWQGDTASVSSFLNRYDGLIKIIAAATTGGTATAVAGPVTTSNIRTIVQNIVSKIGDVSVLVGNPNVNIYMGYDMAELYRQKVFADNLYHVNGLGDQKGMAAEGSVHKIIPLHGLDGLGSSSGAAAPFIFALDPDRNLFLGVDMENEEEESKVWYSQDDDNVKYSFRFRRGWQVAYPSEIIEYGNT